ncbi:Histone deacetylase 8 [Entomortierella beljakovae]|nr:Histone deacetylase 8 [Entomortierella beljakovae]
MTQSSLNVQKRIAYIYSAEYAEIASLLPSNIDRSKKIHALIQAYNLLDNPGITVISPRRATTKELCRYHARDYIDFLKNVETLSTSEQDNEDQDDNKGSLDGKLEDFGLQYDCSVFENISRYIEFNAGSTIEAARLINDDAFDIVFHWDGGRHHAKKDMAAGFCYVNDIVLGIMELQKSNEKVMYIDLDVHHGDGVENAFQFSDKVLTVSIHHYAEGFYPGTGSGISTSSRTKAAVNVPLKSGLSEATLLKIFDNMIDPLSNAFAADAIILQCGVDGMTRDPLGKWNLGLKSYGGCLKRIMEWRKPLIVLGGGGYKTSSAARCYSYMTSLCMGIKLSEEIPEHEYFEDYEPDFMINVDPGRQVDENTDEYLEQVRKLVEDQSKSI